MSELSDYAMPRLGRIMGPDPRHRTALERALHHALPHRTIERCTGLPAGSLAAFVVGDTAPTPDQARAVAEFLRHPDAELLFEVDAPAILRDATGRPIRTAAGDFARFL